MHATDLTQYPESAVGIVGVAGRFPGADSVEALWSNLVNGVESIRRFSAEELIAMGVEREIVAQVDPKVERDGVCAKGSALLQSDPSDLRVR